MWEALGREGNVMICRSRTEAGNPVTGNPVREEKRTDGKKKLANKKKNFGRIEEKTWQHEGIQYIGQAKE